EVLGTSFNVKTSDSGKEVQVAVIEGSVSFGGRSETDGIAPVVLTDGQFAQMNSGDQTLRVEEFGVENYLVWMRGRLVFDDLSLNQACLQLNRLYGLECSYSEESLSEKRLTADFSPDSIEKSLSVISLSLDLDYERNGRKVTWFRVE
ncbi:MAG: FecR domain-containing protein, partial [Balneolaceae bacterium]